MEMEYGIEPASQFAETVKDTMSDDVAVPDISFVNTDTSASASTLQTNGIPTDGESQQPPPCTIAEAEGISDSVVQNDTDIAELAGSYPDQNTEVLNSEPVVESSKTGDISEVGVEENLSFKIQVEQTSTVEKCDGYDELNEIIKSENQEITDEFSVGDDINADLITQFKGQNTEFSVTLPDQVTVETVEVEFEAEEQVLNKEELLDILEGNEPENSKPLHFIKHMHKSITFEDREEIKKLALKQLNSLPRGNQKKVTSKTPIVESSNEDQNMNASLNKSRELIKVLVEDWDDDEVTDQTESNIAPETVVKQEDQEETRTDDMSPQPASTNTLPQRRVSRVIKKKVIFDPDNPDTFTSKKTPQRMKTKSPQSQNKDEALEPSPKKVKAEVVTPKIREKTPGGKTKTVWKKPTPKANKQNKRLSEVDRLLMDEGAVNMMYQLNKSGDSESPKEKKNIRSKAAFIKKINETTPETHEIKFRERKKELTKDVTSGVNGRREGRKRNSTSTSMAASSPAPDHFETHNADDSIIIRRHSSSSYSSSCMSPRRLSDFEPSANTSEQRSLSSVVNSEGDKFNEIFMSDVNDSQSEILGKNECLSLKEKLNSKLSRVLNVKRKREVKIEGKAKNARDDDSCNESIPNFDKLKITIDEHVAEINILKNDSKAMYDITTLNELKNALEYVNRRSDVSVTLLLSESGELCGGLDLQYVKQHNVGTKLRLKAAQELANAARSLFVCMEQHGKFVCAGVEGACAGTGLALLALCDVVLASDRATFHMLSGEGHFTPGVAVLTSHRKSLCRSMVTEMLVFGRQLSASEALARGLVSRTLWPDRFPSELRATVRDIAAQSPTTLQLKKKLLGLRNSVEPESTFLACLRAEQSLLTTHWCSENSSH